MSKWVEFYRGRMNERYEKHIRTKYSPFIMTIAEQIKYYNNQNITPAVVELGCGIGSITKALHSIPDIKAMHLLIDNDVDMLMMAKENIGESHYTALYLQDIRSRSPLVDLRPQIVHSHGVLEHMSDKDIQSILSMWGDQKHFHYVPSYRYEVPSFGDERLLDQKTWETITDSTVVEFNDGYDYMLIR